MHFRLPGRSLMAAALLCLSVTACDQAPVPQIRCATGSWAPFDLLFIGERQGYVDPDAIHLIESPRTIDNTQAMRSDAIDAVGVSLMRAVKWAAEGVDLTIVLVADDSAGADLIVAKPGINSITDLKDKKVAVDLDTVSGYFLIRELELNEMTLADIEVIDLPVGSNAPNVFDKVDAVVAYADDAYDTVKKGGHIMADSRSLPGELLDVFVVRTDYLERYPDRVAELARGWLRSRVLFGRSTQQQQWQLARLAVNPDVFMKTIRSLRLITPDENDLLLAEDGRALMSTIAKNREFLIRVGAIAPDSPLPKISRQPFAAALAAGIEP